MTLPDPTAAPIDGASKAQCVQGAEFRATAIASPVGDGLKVEGNAQSQGTQGECRGEGEAIGKLRHQALGDAAVKDTQATVEVGHPMTGTQTNLGAESPLQQPTASRMFLFTAADDHALGREVIFQSGEICWLVGTVRVDDGHVGGTGVLQARFQRGPIAQSLLMTQNLDASSFCQGSTFIPGAVVDDAHLGGGKVLQ